MEEPRTVEIGGTAPLNRRSGRVHVSFPVTLIWHEAMQRLHEKTKTVSVSRYGCLLRCEHSFPLGSTIRIEHGYKFMLGTVSYCLKDYATKTTELGIAFEDDGSDLWGITFPE
jgi:hypothetical protein